MFFNNTCKQYFSILVTRKSASVSCISKSDIKEIKNQHNMDRHHLSSEYFECFGTT